MIGRLNHIAIAVPNLEISRSKYKDMFGVTVSEPFEQIEHNVKVCFISLPNTKIELIAPLDKESPIINFLEKNPSGGIHHVCYEVKSILDSRNKLIKKGARIVGNGEPKIGAHGKPILFLHPKDFDGTLIELEEI